jgi:hypothetical protein
VLLAVACAGSGISEGDGLLHDGSPELLDRSRADIQPHDGPGQDSTGDTVAAVPGGTREATGSQAAIRDLNDDRPRPVLSGCTAAEVYLRDRIALPDRAQIKKEVEQTKATLMAQAASRDEQEGAGRRAVEAVLSRYGYLEFRGTMSAYSQAAGRKE